MIHNKTLKECVSYILITMLSLSLFGQEKAITLDEAIALAREEYVGLERDRLLISKYEKLASVGLPSQPTQLYISGEEFGSNGQTGVHSLNIQQNFYLPKASEAQQEYYQRSAILAERQMALTDRELARQVQLAYYQLQYTTEAMEIMDENVQLYSDFLEMTTTQLTTGETGRLPQLAARSRLGQAQLEYQHATESYDMSLSLFNQWLSTETDYTTVGTLTLSEEIESVWQDDNPHLQIIQAQQELAQANIETQKAQLLPQINSGLKLQNAFGNFPLFGYQVGVNVPLFKKAYEGRIQAAEIETQVQTAALRTEEQKLQRTLNEIRYRMEHQRHTLSYLTEELRPLLDEQSQVNLQAYREGEIGYLEYLDSLEQIVQAKQQYLEALYKYHLLKAEKDYWTGR